MELYMIKLYNKETESEECAIMKSDSHILAERAGMEYAKLWASQGFEFYCVAWLDKRQFDAGKIIHIS